MDNFYTMHFVEFLMGGYYLYYQLRSIFGRWILFILDTTQYIRGVDTSYTMHYVVFFTVGYYSYFELRSILGGWILFILCTTQKDLRGRYYLVPYTNLYYPGNGYYLYYTTTQYFRGIDHIFTMHYVCLLYTSPSPRDS